MEKNNFIVSIDLGCNNVVAAMGVKRSDGLVEVQNLVIKPMSGMVRGEVTNIEQVTSSLKEAVGELEQLGGIEVKEAYVGISGQHIVTADNYGFVYVGSDGEIREEEVKKLCENMNNVQPPEGKVILSRIPQSYKIDSQEVTASPVGMFGRRLDATFSFILGGKNAIERQSKALDRVSIGKKQLFPSAVASAMAVATDDERELGVAVIDLGAGTTDLCIYQDNTVRYAAVIPIGSDAINKDVRATAIPEYCIEQLKTDYGYATASAIPADKLNLVVRIPGRTQRDKNKDISYRDLSTIIEARLLDIIDFVIDEIKSAGYHNRLGAGIVLTGGGSLMAGIDVLFKERTGYEVRLASAEHNLTEESRDKVTDPRTATAVGLLLLGMGVSDIKPTPRTERPKAEQTERAPKPTPKPEKRSEPEEDEPTNEPEAEPEKPAKRRGGFGKWIAGVFDKTFGVVEDDEEI